MTDNIDDVLAAHANDRGDAIEVLETKVGVNSSAVTASIDYFLKHASGAYRTHIHDGTSDDGANIPDTSLSQITTASKVSGAAITALANLPSGAGEIPVANIPTGTTANKVLKLDANAKIPAVDGSQVTNLNAAAKGANSDITSLAGLTSLSSIAKTGAYTGNGLLGKVIAHGLGRVPVFIMVVQTEEGSGMDWQWISGMGALIKNLDGESDAVTTPDATNFYCADRFGNRDGYHYTWIAF